MKKHFEQNEPIMTDGERRRVWGAIHDAREAKRNRGRSGNAAKRAWGRPAAALGGIAVALLVVLRLGMLDPGDRTAIDQLAGAEPERTWTTALPEPAPPQQERDAVQGEARAEAHDEAPAEAHEVSPAERHDEAPAEAHEVSPAERHDDVAAEAPASRVIPEPSRRERPVAPPGAAAPKAEERAAEHASALRAAQLRQQAQDAGRRADAVAQLEESIGRSPGHSPERGLSGKMAGPKHDLAKIVPLDALGGEGSIEPATFVGSAVGSLAVVWRVEKERQEEEARKRREAEEARRAERASEDAKAAEAASAELGRALDRHRTELRQQGHAVTVAEGPAAAGAPGRLTGWVVDRRNDKPVGYVDIVIRDSGRGGITRSAGSFDIDGIAAGVYTVIVNRVGYSSRLIEGVPIREGLETKLIVALELSEQTTGRVTAGLSEGGIVDADGRVHVRGARKDETKYQVDGMPMPAPKEEETRVSFSADSELPEQARIQSGIGGGLPVSPPGDDSRRRRSPISVGGTDPVNGRKFDAMFFEHYGVNPFVDAQEDRLATFAVDVDNASYTLTRSYLERNALPPKEAVRVEEFVNAFTHDYAPPLSEPFRSASFTELRGETPDRKAFAIHTDLAPSRFGDDMLLLRVGLKGREIRKIDRKPANLTFVIDVSGSMNRENRLGLVKRSLRLLLDELTPADQVALVVYGSTARTILPPTSLENRGLIETAIERLVPGGSTNAEHGLVEGYIHAARAFQFGAINRVILCSDGVANVGRTGADDILARIGRDASRGIELTTVGFGMGNYNDVMMEKLANNGDGNYYYVDGMREARRVFCENVTGTLQTIAQQVKAQVEFNDETVRRYRLLGYENRDVADEDFRNDTVDAGEIGAGHEVTALFEIKLEKDARNRTRGRIATVRVRHEDPGTFEITERKRDVDLSEAVKRFDLAPPSFRLDAAVAEFAELLRHSYWAKDGELNDVYRVAYDAANDLPSRTEADEFLRLVDRAKNLRHELEQRWDRPDWMPDDY